MKITKLSAWIMAGALMCTTPALTYADTGVSEEILTENKIDSLLDDPDQVVDIIMYVKDTIDQQDISEEDLMEVIHLGEEKFGVQLNEEEEQAILKIVKKVQDVDLDEEELRSNVTSVYSKLEELGIGKKEIKGFLEKTVDFLKGLLGE